MSELFKDTDLHVKRGCCTPDTQTDCKFNVKSLKYIDVSSTIKHIY